MRQLVWTEAAEVDLQEIFAEMEEFREGSGESFLSLIGASLDLILQFPEMAPVYEHPVRRLVLQSRKYGLFYTVENRGIIIHALAELRGNPDDLKRRFRRITGS